MTRATIVLLVVLAATASLAQADEPAVLDWQRSYWRFHLVFRAPQFDPPIKDRRGHEHQFVTYYLGHHLAPMRGRIRYGEIPDGWSAADFDDSLWPRDIAPDHGGGVDVGYNPVVRVKLLRGRFRVDDPSKVKGLRLAMEYAGGVAVFLNGRPVARAHLPSGELTPDTMAEGYLAEAYDWIPPKEGGYYKPDIIGWYRPPADADPKARRSRTLETAIDAKLLRPGVNVLAIELHQSSHHARAAEFKWQGMMGGQLPAWSHGTILGLSLSADPAGAIAASARSAAAEVWVEDIHRRVVNRDFGPAGGATPILRLVSGRNMTASCQLAVGSDRALDAVAANIDGLRQVNGDAVIPASALQVRYGVGRSVDTLRQTRFGAHISYYNAAGVRLLQHYAPDQVRFETIASMREPSKEVQELAKEIEVFDHLSPVPQPVAAGSARPIWLTVRVPADAKPGEYRGTLRVELPQPRDVPVRLQVIDTTLPSPEQWATFVGLRPATLHLADAYKVEPWSDRHWQLMDASMQWLAQVGADLAVLPLVVDGEADNKQSMVPLVADGDGYRCDFTQLDRYLDLVAGRLGKDTHVVAEICWAPWRGGKVGWALEHKGLTVVRDGKPQTLDLPQPGTDQWRNLFLPFAKAVRERVKAKGFANLHWGWFYDAPGPVEKLAAELAAAVPDVGWARASHEGRHPFAEGNGAKVTLDMRIRSFTQPFEADGTPVSRRGWQDSGQVLFPRHASQVQAMGRFEAPMAWRRLTENALVYGGGGFGRIGADYFPPFTFGNWYQPFVGNVLYAGKDGAEGSVGFEALREGIQEAELRILLEKSGRDKAEPAAAVLAERIMVIGTVPSGPEFPLIGEYAGQWQQRLWDLLSAASENPPPAEARAAFFRAPTAP